MKKNGQITVFIIIALVLLLMTMIIFYAISIINDKPIRTDPFDSVKLYIENCHQQVANDAINLLSLQGGYIELEGDYLITPYQEISYQIPSNEEIIQDINQFIEQGILKCIDVSEFQEKGYSIEIPQKATSTTSLYDETINFNLEFPIQITIGDQTKSITNFEYTAKARLNYILEIMRFFLTQDEWMDLSRKYDVNINVITYENSLIYNIEDPKSITNGHNLNFLSARRI